MPQASHAVRSALNNIINEMDRSLDHLEALGILTRSTTATMDPNELASLGDLIMEIYGALYGQFEELGKLTDSLKGGEA